MTFRSVARTARLSKLERDSTLCTHTHTHFAQNVHSSCWRNLRAGVYQYIEKYYKLILDSNHNSLLNDDVWIRDPPPNRNSPLGATWKQNDFTGKQRFN